MMTARFATTSLLIGNFVVGVSIVGPAGMLGDLATGLGVTIADIGLLVTYGAVALCFASPLGSWATSRIDRRLLLAGSLALIALGNLASALAPNYATLLVVRLLMMIVAAPYTPQAAGTAALLVAPADRPKAVAYVFIGWSLSVAAGLPIITFLAAHLGWREAYGVYAAAAAVSAVLLAIALPPKLRGTPVSPRSWLAIAGNRQIVLILLVTALQVSGQFAIFTFLGPILFRLIGAGPETVATFFIVFGVAALLGNVIVTEVVSRLGAFSTTAAFMGSTLVGLLFWTLGAGVLPAMLAGAVFWGFGFAAANSMQQARLIAAAPALASGSVALNTSFIYVGQAVGSALGSVLLARDLILQTDYLAVALVLAALGVLFLTRGPAERVLAPAE
jgi:predicted MFS family arabinose efflux permease